MSNPNIHPIFAITADQVGKAFDVYEANGEKNQKVSIGERQTVDVPISSQDQATPLILAVLFLPPLAQAGFKVTGLDVLPNIEPLPTGKLLKISRSQLFWRRRPKSLSVFFWIAPTMRWPSFPLCHSNYWPKMGNEFVRLCSLIHSSKAATF